MATRVPECHTVEWNDTLGGRLYAYEHEDQKHLRPSVGYWRMVEKRMIREEMKAEGLDADSPRAFWEIERRVVRNHANDSTYRQINEAWQARCRAAAPPESENAAIVALREIAAGHNDARGLAAEVLAKLGLSA